LKSRLGFLYGLLELLERGSIASEPETVSGRIESIGTLTEE
jgi:hypothetical protein